MTAIDAPILFDILRRTIPEGVELNIHEHTEEHYEARFIPDPFLIGIKTELKEMAERYEKEKESSIEAKQEREARKEQKKLAELYSNFDDEDDE